jgi:hypothetical protein
MYEGKSCLIYIGKLVISEFGLKNNPPLKKLYFKRFIAKSLSTLYKSAHACVILLETFFSVLPMFINAIPVFFDTYTYKLSTK